MIRSQIELYAVIYDPINNEPYLISKHSDASMPSMAIDLNCKTLNHLLSSLFQDICQLSSQYVKFISLEPMIRNGTLVLPYYVIIPQNTEINTNRYQYVPVLSYNYDSEILRKVFNFI